MSPVSHNSKKSAMYTLRMDFHIVENTQLGYKMNKTDLFILFFMKLQAINYPTRNSLHAKENYLLIN